MTVMTASPRAKAGATPVKAAGARGAKPVPPPAAPPGPRRRQIALTPMRSETAKSLRRLAAHVQGSHPDMSVHQHLRDAARVLESGNEEGSQRHLRAAMFALTPQSLLRNGVRDDPGHLAAREAMHGVHRHLLLVKDIVDAGEKNRAAIARDSYGDLQSAPSLPSSPVHADPNAGYGPGALAQKPVARQPGGDRALNAPARTNSGGSDPAVADPVGPQPRGSKQFAHSWDDLAAVVGAIDLAARNGVHIPGTSYDWRHTYIPLTPAAARSHYHGKIPSSWHPSGGGEVGKAAGPLHVKFTDSAGRVSHHTIHDKETADSFRKQAAQRHMTVEEGAEPDLSGLPKNARALYDAASKAGWNVSHYPGEMSDQKVDERTGQMIPRSGTPLHGITASNPVTGQKVSQSWQGGKRSTYNAPESLQASMEKIKANPVTKEGMQALGTTAGKHARIASQIDDHAREFSARGKGANAEQVGYIMSQAANALRSGDKQGAIGNLRRASMLSETSGSVHAMGTGSAKTVIDKHLQSLGAGSSQLAYGWDELATVIEMAATLTKEQAHYRPGGVPGHRCGDCTMIRGDRCTLVEGLIDPGHVCDHFDAAGASLSITWDDLASVVELSARTAQLEVTPAPYGKPGGPGLYHVKGLKHSDYLEQIVHALMTKRGMGKGQATAIARGAIRKWSRGGGKVHPEVRAAAAGAEAEELKAQARAHAHAATWDDIGKVIEMTAAPTWDDVASVIEMAAAAAVPGQQIAAGQPAAAAAVSPAKSANATAQPRVAAGAPAGGQFAPAGSGGGGGKQPMDAHQQHVAHLQHLATHGTPAQQQAAKTLLGRMSAGSGKTAASKPAAPKTTVKAPATVPATAKSTAKTTPKTTAKTIAKTTTSKASTGTTAKSTSKAAASKAASTTAKATAHQQHTAHVAHLQHLATHGNPAQQKAAKAVLARMGVKP